RRKSSRTKSRTSDEGRRTFFGRRPIASRGANMAIAFSALDRQLTRDIRQLHDYLWDSTWTGNESKLQASLMKGAKSLDTFLHAGGRLRKNAEALVNPWNRERQGSSLF